MLFAATFVGHLLLFSGAATNDQVNRELEDTCVDASCSGDATQVPSLLQKAKSQVVSTVLPDDDEMTDETAADLVMQELEEIGAQHEKEVKHTLAFNRQKLMLEEAEIRAHRAIRLEEDAKVGEDVSFNMPFDTSSYSGSFGRFSSIRGKVTSAKVFYKIDDKFIHIGMASNNGFVGVGLNGRNPSMRNADIVVCRDWAGDGKVTVRDFHATGNSAPQPDGAEDWKIDSSGHESGKDGNQITWCVMHRARVTCEIWEDYQAYETDTTLFGLIAWSAPSATTDMFSYHGYYQREVLPFAFPGPSAIKLKTKPAGSKALTVAAPTTKVPVEAGSYVCSYHLLPLKAKEKGHIIQWNAIWDPTSPAYKAKVQHHIDLNACSTPLSVADGGLINCAAAMGSCAEVLLTGVSQYSKEGSWMDDDAGIAIGDGGATMVLVSRHFYNPSNKGGVIDTSTRFEITWTNKLRKNNFMMFIVTTSQVEVPAKTLESISQDYCTSECTERLQGSTQIRFIGFHMHLAGKTAKLRLVRDGHEIEPIMIVDPWDDAMSSARVKRTIVPGDNLLGECIYKNPGDHIIGYGAELSQEMCVITMSVVGPGSMKMCADMPWGQKNPPNACKVKKKGKWTGKYRPWPICKTGVPMTYCPDAANSKGQPNAKPMLDTEKGHTMKFVPWGKKKRRDCVGAGPTRELVPAQPGSCNVVVTNKNPSNTVDTVPSGGVGSRADECAEDRTSHAITKPGVIVGELELDGDLKVSWETDCKKNKITFVVEAKAMDVGWLAVGLIDGGDMNAPLGKPGNSMSNLDVVMLDPTPKKATDPKIKDAMAMGYTPPKEKQTPKARYVEGGQKCGNTYATFTRPLTAKEGVTLKEDGFVYLCAAYKTGPPVNFVVKHSKARAMRLKASLFGGTHESYRQKDGAVEPEPEPEPESEAEANVNQPLASGTCTEPGTCMQDCWAWAGNANVLFQSSKEFPNVKFPRGCFFKNGKLFFNPKGKGTCSKSWQCICKSKHPEPEPEPEAEVPLPVAAGSCSSNNGKDVPEDKCVSSLEKAFSVTVAAAGKLMKLTSVKWPPGCFMLNNKKAFFNKAADSKTECARKGVKGCVCEMKLPPKKVTKVTKAPAPAPGVELNPFKEVNVRCAASNVVALSECKEMGDKYVKSHNLPFGSLKLQQFTNNKWPGGCWLLPKNGKLFFNKNQASPVKCGAKATWCLCEAAFVITNVDADCTHRIKTKDECLDAAISQGVTYTAYKVVALKGKFPLACFKFGKNLWFNTGHNAGKCGDKKTQCICEL